jgi:large subunit ribosomal protein L4
VFDAGVFDAPSTKQAAQLLTDWDATGSGRAPWLIVLADTEANAGLSFRNLRGTAVVPVSDTGIADLIGAASLLVSEAALTELTARANGTAQTTGEAVA